MSQPPEEPQAQPGAPPMGPQAPGEAQGADGAGNAANQATGDAYPQVNPPDMTQAFVLMQQQNQLLMNIVMGKGGGKGSGGGTTNVASNPQMMKPTVAPEFRGQGFEYWRKNVRDWENVHYALDPRQRPGLLMAGLKGEALALARAAVGDRLQDPDSYKLILDTLEAHYGDNAKLRQFREFQKLISVENTGDNLEAYLHHFTIRVEQAREENLVLPESLQVFMLFQLETPPSCTQRPKLSYRGEPST